MTETLKTPGTIGATTEAGGATPDRADRSREVSRLLWSLLLAGAVASAVLFVASQSSTAPLRQQGSEGALYVQLEAPGVGIAIYRMPPGSRVRDVFRAARVPEPRGIDGNGALAPGQALRVEEDGGVSSAWMPGDQMVALGVAIPLNECGLQDLVAIPGIGQATALKILKGRVDRGRFDSFSELADLPGVGGKTVLALRQHGRL